LQEIFATLKRSDAKPIHDAVGASLEAAILRLLDGLADGRTICPSQAARAVAGDERSHWHPLMEPARAAAQRLVDQGEIVITQGGVVVDGATAKGPIRLRRR
jgi:hypothetical protein